MTRRASVATAALQGRNRDLLRLTPAFAGAGAPGPTECGPEWPRDWLLPTPSSRVESHKLVAFPYARTFARVAGALPWGLVPYDAFRSR
jgi:hypothetical protein